jgi:aryl carrier-like protein
MAVVPPGTTGELHVSGPGVARGYHDRPGLTAAHFLPDPHATVPGARCYRTGDRARELAGAEFEFHGRTDRQVKVNGFRVELGEIEAALAAHDRIGTAVVTVVTDAVGKRIVAHVAPVAGVELDAVALRAWIADRLPRHCRPHNYVVVPRVPLDANGKFRRDDLGDAHVSRAAQSTGLPPYQPPEAGLEATIAEAFVDVLAIDRVGAHDNFFEIGGDSLRCVRVLDRLRQHGISLALRQFFGNATVAGLAELATSGRGR